MQFRSASLLGRAAAAGVWLAVAAAVYGFLPAYFTPFLLTSVCLFPAAIVCLIH